MKICPKLLASVGEKLSENGATFGASTLNDLAAAVSFLDAIKYNDNSDVVAATFSSLFLPFEQARSVPYLSTSSIALVPKLDETRLTSKEFQLAEIVARGTPHESAVAASLFFVMCHRAARSGNFERTTSLNKLIQDFPASEQAQDILDRLKRAIDNFKVERSGEMTEERILFSISIDIAGSTDAKSRIMKLAAGDGRRIDKFNTQIYKEFCRIEEKFYMHAAEQFGSGNPVELSRFFAVKGIGDEIWLLCETSPELITGHGIRLIDAALKIASKKVQLIATENEPENSMVFDRDFDFGDCEPVHAPIKVFIDVVQHATDLGKMRDDRLISVVPQIMSRTRKQTPALSELTHIRNRLSFGRTEETPWSRLQAYRTDYIGHEIDRFFRATKAALPGTVAIGSSMAKHLELEFPGAASGITAVHKRGRGPLSGGELCDPIHAICDSLKSDDMKGIGYDYDVYKLFAPRSLNAIYSEIKASKQNGLRTADYSPTQKILTEEKVAATAALYYPKENDDSD